jgi:Ca2+-dependent lipid-binding protein
MTLRHQHPDGLVDVEIISLTLGGKPSGVSAVLFKLIYLNGTISELDFQFTPNEIMYETFLEEFNRLKASLTERSK